MIHRFIPPYLELRDMSLINGEMVGFMEQYQGNIDPTIHIENCIQKLSMEGLHQYYLVHNFLYTLDSIPSLGTITKNVEWHMV